MTCAALLASLGFTLADLDRHKVYEIPAAQVAAAPAATVWLAKRCAARAGIRWRIVGG
jgi:hypothetical protein